MAENNTDKAPRRFTAHGRIEYAFSWLLRRLDCENTEINCPVCKRESNIAFDDIVSLLDETLDAFSTVAEESALEKLKSLKETIESYTERFADRDKLYDWPELVREWKNAFSKIQF